MKSLDPVDAGTARELMKLERPEDILQHYKENADDYDIVNLSTALSRVTTLSSAMKPWKRTLLPAAELQNLCAHSTSELRKHLKKEADLARWLAETELAAKSDPAAAKDLAKSPKHAVQLRTIVSSVYSLAKLGKCPPTLLHEIGYVMKQPGRLDEANPIDVSQLAYSFSRSNVRAPQFFNAIARRVVSDVDSYRDKEVTSLVLSFTSLKTAAPELFAAAAKRMAQRGEQVNTITPQILSNLVVGLARSIRLDDRLPERMREPETGTEEEEGDAKQQQQQKRRQARIASEALHVLSKRIERTARQHRVPGIDEHAFTPQGLATTAWSYAAVFKASIDQAKVTDPSAVARLGEGIGSRIQQMVSAAAAAGAASVVPVAEADWPALVRDRVISSISPDSNETPSIGLSFSEKKLHAADVVRVFTSLAAAFTHPQTLSAASAINLSMMARAQADASNMILAQLAIARAALAFLERPEIRERGTDVASASAARRGCRQEIERLQVLLDQLDVRSTLDHIARAAVRILDPASGGDQQVHRAEVAKEDVYRNTAKDEAKSDDDNAVVIAAKRMIDARAAKGDTRAVAAAAAAEGAEEVDEDMRAAMEMIRKAEASEGRLAAGSDSDHEIDVVIGEDGHLRHQDQYLTGVDSAAAASPPLTRRDEGEGSKFQRLLSRGIADDDEGSAVAAAKTSDSRSSSVAVSSSGTAAASEAAAVKFNPLRLPQSMALSIPFSMFDIATLVSALADTATPAPELWSKVADRVERAAVIPGSKQVDDESGDGARSQHDHLGGKRSMGPDRQRLLQGKEDGLRDMRSVDTATLAHAAAVSAPDVHAARILQNIAVVFVAEDAELEAKMRDIVQLRPQQQHNEPSAPSAGQGLAAGGGHQTSPQQYRATWESSSGSDSDADSFSDGERSSSKPVQNGSIGTVDTTDGPLPTFDDEPTWRDDELEALRRSKRFHKAPAIPAFRLRGDAPDTLAVHTYGVENPDVGSLEKLSVYGGTKKSWTARLMTKAPAETLLKLVSAFAVALPTSGTSPSSDAAVDVVDNVEAGSEVVEAAVQSLQQLAASASAEQCTPPWWHYMTQKQRNALPAIKKRRHLTGLHPFQSAAAAAAIVPATPMSHGWDGIAAMRYLLVQLSTRVVYRERELQPVDLVQFLKLMITRNEAVLDQSVARLQQQFGIMSNYSHVWDKAVRTVAKSVSNEIERLQQKNQPMAPNAEVDTYPSREGRGRGTGRDSPDRQQRRSPAAAPSGPPKATRLPHKLSVYAAYADVFGLAVDASLTSLPSAAASAESGFSSRVPQRSVEQTLDLNRNLHRALFLLLDESARRLNVATQSESMIAAKAWQYTNLATSVAAALAPLVIRPLASGSPQQRNETAQAVAAALSPAAAASGVELSGAARLQGHAAAWISQVAAHITVTAATASAAAAGFQVDDAIAESAPSIVSTSSATPRAVVLAADAFISQVLPTVRR